MSFRASSSNFLKFEALLARNLAVIRDCKAKIPRFSRNDICEYMVETADPQDRPAIIAHIKQMGIAYLTSFTGE